MSHEATLNGLKTALEIIDPLMKGIHPGVEAITALPLKLIEYYEVFLGNKR